MLTDVVSLWEHLRAESVSSGRTLERLVRPDADVEIVLRKGPNDCSLVISPGAPLDWYEHLRTPTCVICSPALTGQQNAICIRLRDWAFEEIFVWFSQDLANRLYGLEGSDAPKAIAKALNDWGEAFRVVAEGGMSRQSQQGLFAELFFLEYVLAERYSDDAYLAWNSQNSVHDFQIGACAWEVKSFAGRRHEVRVSSEDQLDSTGLDSLQLVVIGLKVSEVAGTSIPEMVSRILGRIDSKSHLLLHFRAGLAKYGYVSESSVVQKYYFTPKSLAQYQVQGDFPRIAGSALPSAVHDVKYVLSLTSLEHHVAEPIVHFDVH